MTYTFFNRILPGIWKQEYWPYVVTNQCLILCIRRYVAATEVGDFEAAQEELESATQLLTAANQSIHFLSSPPKQKGAISLIQEQPLSPFVCGTVLPDVPIADWNSWHHTTTIPSASKQQLAKLKNYQQLHSVKTIYPTLIRWSGNTLGYLLLAVLGVVLAGCLALMANQMSTVMPVMETVLKIFWRWMLLAIALFVSGAIIISLKAQ